MNDIRVAVLTLTRDRLPYTKHCFQLLRLLAGCRFDHYVLDNGSTDGTAGWLETQPLHTLIVESENVGIHKGMNRLLELAAGGGYDVICKVDNDCELVTDNTIAGVAQLVRRSGHLLSPKILGIGADPPQVEPFEIDGQPIDARTVIGGIFHAYPAHLFDGFRFDETEPTWGRADTHVCQHMRALGHQVGYVPAFEARHYLTTWGQEADIPWYFARVKAEGAPV